MKYGSAETFLLEKIRYQLDSFSKKRTTQRRRAIALKVAITGSAGLTTVLLGWHGLVDDLYAKNAALALSALVALLSGIDSYLSPGRLWVEFAKTRVQLKALETDMLYQLAKKHQDFGEDDYDEFYKRFSSIMSTTAENYQSVRSEQAKGSQTLTKSSNRPRTSSDED